MAVRVTCPNPECGAAAAVEERSLGKRGRCKKCGHVFALARPDGRAASGTSDATSAWKQGKGASPASPLDLPEQFGRYRIMRPLGRGGMGAVYLAHDTRLDRRVALKVPLFGPSDGPEAVRRFGREARAAATLDHPNLCPIHDVGEVDGVPYLTMPHIEGTTLAEGRADTEGEAIALARTLALALHEAHVGGIIHRDLKPGNIMINRRGEPIVMDFGLARMAGRGEAPLTRSGHVLGTATHMAPEQAAGDLDAVGPAADVYSLGVILYELLAGRPPFEGPWSLVIGLKLVKDPDPPSKHRPGLGPALDAICLKAIARDPADRYPTMADFAEALAKVADPPPERPGRPRVALAAAGAGAAALLLLLGIVIYVATDRGRIKIVVNDPKAVVKVDGREVVIEGFGSPISLRAGEHDLAIKREGGEVEARRFVVRRGDNEDLVVTFEPKPGPGPTPAPPVAEAGSIINTLGMTLRLIPAGSFAMGSDEADPDAPNNEKVAGKKHAIRITRPFYLGSTEVTVGQFRKFAEATGFLEDPAHPRASPGFPQGDDHPVVNVGALDALAFCEWLGRAEGHPYRLPTEAEWEYACRAGTSTRFWFGDDPEGHATAANLLDDATRDGFAHTSPAGRLLANPFGLRDMHGNAWEWCSDAFEWYSYASSPADDPRCAAETGLQVVRGGSWAHPPGEARSAHRGWHSPDERFNHTGFRVARDAPAGLDFR